jgi:hypothetical protein
MNSWTSSRRMRKMMTLSGGSNTLSGTNAHSSTLILTIKGLSTNVFVEWENGEITKEPLVIIAADNPVTCAIYAKEEGLLDKEGGNILRRLSIVRNASSN